jgi:DivIVA domain-containing protein
MSADRQAVERGKFPLVRRGYDPGAVDAHLAAVADHVEALERRAAEPSAAAPAPAASAGRAASEQVRGIVEAAEHGAAEIERAARADADEIRAEAAARARAVLARVDAVEEELGRLLDGMRAAVLRLAAEADETPAPAEQPFAPAEDPPAPGGDLPAPDGESGAAVRSDAAGARFVALDMALSGSSREETDRVLRETFGPADRAELLDEVWAALPG